MHRTRRAFIGGGIAALLIVSGAMVALGQARTPTLPPVTPASLIASVLRATAADPTISGEVVATVDLGIPDLPAEAPSLSGPASILQAIQGVHRIRVWRSPGGLRIAELLPAAERSLWISRTDVWTWDSRSFTALHAGQFPEAGTESPAAPGAITGRVPDALASPFDPLGLARAALAAIGQTTSVSVGTSSRVAGRACYVLVVVPRDAGTLVGRVEVAVDAERRLPLGVEVFARGADSPSVSVRFGSVGFSPIDPSTFRFSPPSGARVVRPAPPALLPAESGRPARPGTNPITEYLPGFAGSVRVFGRDWSSVLAVRMATPPPGTANAGAPRFDVGGLQRLLPFSGPLFSVRLEPRGDQEWLLVGAVPQSALVRAGA